MIKIQIESKDGKVFDSLEYEGDTLQENSLVLRRLEEIKLKLLDMNYKSDLEIVEGGEAEDDN